MKTLQNQINHHYSLTLDPRPQLAHLWLTPNSREISGSLVYADWSTTETHSPIQKDHNIVLAWPIIEEGSLEMTKQ